ncbi:class I SAM-dependent methyltransferase [Henriciella mobilis]|uniref:Class I SAM-dependent methyltransferase n=1 Tax=Henriciella mobilis TaxID=2305467 RepID=A0A399RQP4_9PROT|nr:methyltransferase domain-containing protein [Henriciella mobilis]RIJ32309.1 class I SAM-dependent methyltransferase [Henriciella mobilis]
MEYDEAADVARHRDEVTGLAGLVKHFEWKSEGYELGIDIGGGEGLHAPWILDFVDRLIISDIVKFRKAKEGLHAHEIRNKLERYDVDLDLSRVEFHYADAMDLPYKSNLFDFAISINAFEHIPDPGKALAEILRVTKSGALIIIQFDPLWNSPFGHHLPHLVTEPWAHVINSEEDFENIILENGGSETDIQIFRNDMNGRPFEYYNELFAKNFKHFTRYNFNYWAKNEEEEPNMSHPNFQQARDMGYSEENLIVRGVQFVGLRK